MDRTVTINALARLQTLDDSLCLRVHRATSPAWVQLFRLFSRLGDGPLWIAAVVLAPVVLGPAGFVVSGRLALVGGATFVVYRVVKAAAARPRPFVTHAAISCRLPALDRYAFPSGHTMHAVALTVALAEPLPISLAVLAPLSVLIAASRVALGLHYPSDVLVGALLGAAVAWGGTLLP